MLIFSSSLTFAEVPLVEITKAEVIALLGLLTGTIASLWVIIRGIGKRDQEDLDSCRKMHEEAQEEIKDLNGKYNYLQGRMDGVEQLSKSVLKKIEERRTCDGRHYEKDTIRDDN